MRIELEAKINLMGDLNVHYYFFKEKIMFKSHQIKSNHRVLSKNEVYSNGLPVFAPDYMPTVLAAKMCSNSNEHSMNIRFLWLLLKKCKLHLNVS